MRIALDDFGTGYSSLSYLHSFPFDKIKLDRSFVTDLPVNHHSQTIAKSIIALSHNLKVPVIAEGVESEEQRAMLLSYGCDELQGFLTGKPRPIGDYAQMVGGLTDEDNQQVGVIHALSCRTSTTKLDRGRP